MSSVDCLIPSNADIAGVGVRIAVYVQNVLCFFPASWAIADEKITKYELDSMENMSTTNLVVAFGILISCFVQAPTLGLTNFHTSIVLSMSWMNNTNVFIYFLLYAARLRNRDGSWVMHLRDHVVSGLQLRRFFPPPALPTDEEGFKNHEKEQATPVGGAPASPEKIRLFRRVALVLGSLHLTLMSALGLWLWSDPRGFGTADSACAVDHAHLAIAGGSVAFGSRALRVFSLFIYGLFLMPGFNLLLPMAVFLGNYLVHGKFYPEALQGDLDEPQPLSDTSQSTAKHVWSVAKRISSPKSPVFPAFVGLCFLLVINIVFIVDIELTLRNNREIQEQGEAEWGFGQVLAVLLLFLPLRDLVEMMFRRRQEFQTHLKSELKRAIKNKDGKDIEKWVLAGADPNTKGDDGHTAVDVAERLSDWECIRTLAKSGADISSIFRGGQTAECVRILGTLDAEINTVCKDGQTALEVAMCTSDWEGAGALLRLGANANTVFVDGGTALQAVTVAQKWDIVCLLVEKGGDVNTVFADKSTALQAASLAENWDLLSFLVKKGADVNTVFTDGSTALQAASLALKWDVLCLLVENGVDASAVFTDGRTALEVVSLAQNWDTLRDEKGVGTKRPSTDGENTLEVAVQARDWQGVRILVALGANLDAILQGGQAAYEVIFNLGGWGCVCIVEGWNTNSGINGRRKDVQTAFEVWVQARRWGRVPFLVGLGANINTVFKDGQTALDVATCAEDWEGVHVLAGLKPSVNTHFQDRSTVSKVAREEKWNLILEIIDAGADVNMPVNDDCGTVLYLACRSKCQPTVIEQLLQKGADPNAKSRQGWTALHRACWDGREDFVPLLLAHGADPNLKDNDGDTPLHDACRSGHDKCAVLLLKHRGNPADPNATNGTGRTPLHWAYKEVRQGCIKLLIENGADETIRDIGGRTPARS